MILSSVNVNILVDCMSGVEVIRYGAEYKEEVVSLFYEYLDWFLEGFKEYTGSNFLEITGRKLSDYGEMITPYLELKPPEGSLLLVKTDEGIAGMGVIHKLSRDTGEIKRMYTRPSFRRRGYARLMLNELLRLGRVLGCTKFLLDSPRWSVSHGLYSSTGFNQVVEYPESEISTRFPMLKENWIFMEKIE
jgi:GNAT superfamily N-acetyltransferase